MERSGSQKVLLVLSILNIILAAFVILASLLTIAGGALVGAVPAEEVADSLAETGLTQGQASAAFSAIGLVILIPGALMLLVGILGVRAANNNQKIMPVWVLSVISLVMWVISIVIAVMNGTVGTDIAPNLVSIAIAVLTFWIANNIKREAGK